MPNTGDWQTWQNVALTGKTLTGGNGQILRLEFVNGAFNLNKVTITANGGGTVATPTFSPSGGTYTSAQSVTISTTTSGATIYYTTDGSTPTTSSAVYSSALNIASTTTVKAMAAKSGMTNSAVASATYTISGGTVATPTFSPDGGTFTSSVAVTISCATSGATIKYTTDGSTPSSTNGTTITSGNSVTLSATTTLKAIAYKSGMTDSAVRSATYTKNTDTVYSFADFSTDGAAISGTHSGINFGSGKWCYTVDWAGLSGCAYFANNNQTYRTFVMPSGKALKSIKLSADAAGSTWEVKDSVTGNTKKSGTFASANTPITVTTGWTNASGTITITFSAGWNGVIDDITY